MITTNLTGNFGNHLAQLTIVRIVAEKLNYEWGVNSSPTHDYFQGKNQMYFMNVNFGKQPITNIQHEYHEKWPTLNHNGDIVNIAKYDEDIFNIKDNTILLGANGAKGGIYQSEDYFIERKQDILSWYQINNNHIKEYEQKLKKLNIVLDENLCVINFRGGEYRSIPHVMLRKEYWRDSCNQMLKLNPNMKFLVITDDIRTSQDYMPFPIQTLHIDIGFDFYVVNKAKYIIIANSSFSWWAAWLNTNTKLTIAPKYWSRFNMSNGYWGIGDQYTSCFTYLDREGNLIDYETCKKEALEFYI